MDDTKHITDSDGLTEAERINQLLARVTLSSSQQQSIVRRAEEYIRYLRSTTKTQTSLELFLHEYGLDTKEGIAIMCLAEALLRIPDNATANILIRDKLSAALWEKHLGKSDSLFVNASSWGMLLGKKIVKRSDGFNLDTLISKLGEPVIRTAIKKAMQLIGSQFIIGEDIQHAIKQAQSYEKNGYLLSYDMLGEGARTEKQAKSYFEHYMNAIEALAKSADRTKNIYKNPSISVKLSALHPRYQLIKKQRVQEELLPRLRDIISLAMEHNIPITIDAEEAGRLDISLFLFNKIIEDTHFNKYDGIGLAVQAYHINAWNTLEHLKEIAASHQRKIPIRLVKGAYWDTEIKLAQQFGLSKYPVFTEKHHTDISYLACAQQLLQNPDAFYPQFATHNAHTVAAIIEMGTGANYEFQRLYGMGDGLYDHLAKTDESNKCRIYAPVGQHKELLPYLIRRLLENGASTSFIHQLGDASLTDTQIAADPMEKPIEQENTIPLPIGIYPNRENSAGIDMGNESELSALTQAIHTFDQQHWKAAPLIAGKDNNGETSKHMRPSNINISVGTVTHATEEHIAQAFSIAKTAFASWSHVFPAERADILDKIADLLDKNRYEAMALCVYEAGKTLPDALAELREAIDFCRYYAAILREQFMDESVLCGPTGEHNASTLHGRGVFVCISPWNFPLAIFTGQIIAALAAGNCVIAKPSEQTSLIAYFMVKLMHQAGIPTDVLHLLPGKGSQIGTPIVAYPDVAGVAFTGSTATARLINQTLATKEGAIVPLIAETGGQNAMIVDSTALLEAAVDDIILSAFGSAGQRCSALRVLYVQEDIAEPLIAMLKGAMQELYIGYPEHYSTDIGPVIDLISQQKLQQHIEHMQKTSQFIASAPINGNLQGHYVSPHAFEIDHINQLKGEVFGPILHVIRFPQNNLRQIIDDINNTGFGLTLGLHSRVQETIDLVRKHAKVGNLYINRNMTGATVGVQPFGGEGLSGTGPKAGGPHYLLRFSNERTFTNNLTAIGGNITLLS